MRVLSYNIREGGAGRLDRIAAVIQRQSPDAVALLEAADRESAEWLARELTMRLAFGEANNEQGHVAWLSRLPVRRSDNYRHPGLAKTLLAIEVPAGGGTVVLFATHLGSRWDVPQPADEVPVILSLVDQATTTPHLIVGDFNALRAGEPVGDPPDGDQKRGDAVDGAPRRAIQLMVDAGYVDCYRNRHPRARGYTYPSHHPWLRLDYIFASPALAAHLHSCDVVKGVEATAASDHYAVSAEFRLQS
jgi:endonuclease/exonuclease/phosphatase family metal-dependent hydrolase